MITQKQCLVCGNGFEPEYRDQSYCRLHMSADVEGMGVGRQTFMFRCTRNQPYVDVNCPGRGDVTSRQGYYIKAVDTDAALRIMREKFPEDTTGFTATIQVQWNPTEDTK